MEQDHIQSMRKMHDMTFNNWNERNEKETEW